MYISSNCLPLSGFNVDEALVRVVVWHRHAMRRGHLELHRQLGMVDHHVMREALHVLVVGLLRRELGGGDLGRARLARGLHERPVHLGQIVGLCGARRLRLRERADGHGRDQCGCKHRQLYGIALSPSRACMTRHNRGVGITGARIK
jgi:hypothetical protein